MNTKASHHTYAVSKSQRLTLASLLLIGMASILLYLPVFHWLLEKMSLANGYLHLVALVGLLVLAVFRILKLQTALTHPPILFHAGLFIWIPASILYLLNEANIGFHTLSASLFIAYLYGLSGHFLSKAHWRAMLLPLLLMILVLPFEHYLDIYLGFPLRLLSAEWAGSILQIGSLTTATVESILMIDNKAAIVDLDCSGIKSLWIGLIFYLLLTWVEKYRVNLRWLLIAFLFIALLVLSNVFRIVILVLLDLVFDLPELAAMFHQSLGLLGFAISSIVIWFVLHTFAMKIDCSSSKEINQTKPFTLKQNITATLVIVSIIITFIFLYQPLSSREQPKSDNNRTVTLPTKYQSTATPLTPQEKDFFVNSQASAQKYLLKIPVDNKTLSASMVLVWSQAWKAHHVPENCYLSQGYSISDKGVWAMNRKHSLRFLALDKPVNTNTSKPLTGVYWFQSTETNTPDYSSRVYSSLFSPNQEWLMVSILWNEPVTAEQIQPFITTLQTSLKSSLHSHEN